VVTSEGEVEPWIVVRGVHDARGQNGIRGRYGNSALCGFPLRVFPVREVRNETAAVPLR
jgi:hypothetical protein